MVLCNVMDPEDFAKGEDHNAVTIIYVGVRGKEAD